MLQFDELFDEVRCIPNNALLSLKVDTQSQSTAFSINRRPKQSSLRKSALTTNGPEEEFYLPSIVEIHDEESMRTWWDCIDTIYFPKTIPNKCLQAIDVLMNSERPNCEGDKYASSTMKNEEPPKSSSSLPSSSYTPIKRKKRLSILLFDQTSTFQHGYFVIYALKKIQHPPNLSATYSSQYLKSMDIISATIKQRISSIVNNTNPIKNLTTQIPTSTNYPYFLRVKGIFPFQLETVQRCILTTLRTSKCKSNSRASDSSHQDVEVILNQNTSEKITELSQIDLEIAMLESLSSFSQYQEELLRIRFSAANFLDEENSVQNLCNISSNLSDYIKMLSIRKNLLESFSDRIPYNTDVYFDPPEIAPNIYEEVPKICLSRQRVLAERYSNQPIQIPRLLEPSSSVLLPAAAVVTDLIDDPTKKKKSQKQKMIEIDCSVCFHPLNNENNTVVYCSSCYCSFHKSCYGITTLPYHHFYCQRCMGNKSSVRGIIPKKLAQDCQLCGLNSNNLPIMCLGSQYYHPTCLILFNYVTFTNSTIQFRSSITTAVIADDILNEQSNQCQICFSTKGRKVACCQADGCTFLVHALCAFLNGMEIWLEPAENDKYLELKMKESFYQDLFHLGVKIGFKCATHADKLNRDPVGQAYYRRFQINYEGACKYRCLEDYIQQTQKNNAEAMIYEQQEGLAVQEEDNQQRNSDTIKKDQKKTNNKDERKKKRRLEGDLLDEEINFGDDVAANTQSKTKIGYSIQARIIQQEVLQKSWEVILNKSVFQKKKSDETITFPKDNKENLKNFIPNQKYLEMLLPAQRASRKWKYHLRQKMIKEQLRKEKEQKSSSTEITLGQDNNTYSTQKEELDQTAGTQSSTQLVIEKKSKYRESVEEEQQRFLKKKQKNAFTTKIDDKIILKKKQLKLELKNRKKNKRVIYDDSSSSVSYNDRNNKRYTETTFDDEVDEIPSPTKLIKKQPKVESPPDIEEEIRP